MNLPTLESIEFSGKRVLLRADLDVDVDLGKKDLRIKALLPTLKYLVERSDKVLVIGHKGRPGGKKDESLSLAPVRKLLKTLVDHDNFEVFENLSFEEGEEKNDKGFAEELVKKGDIFVNEAFATSHREHTSIVTLPKLMPHAAGFHFEKEVSNLSKVLDNPERPLVVVLGGAKEDKLDYLDDFKELADRVLVGGKLPTYLDEDYKDEKVLVGKLIPGKEDLTINTAELFEEELKKAGTIVLAGPMGVFEEDGHLMGTKKVFEAVANSEAFKVAGGGDTYEALEKVSVVDRFDWISVGGGASLEFLTKGALPGIDALLN